MLKVTIFSKNHTQRVEDVDLCCRLLAFYRVGDETLESSLVFYVRKDELSEKRRF
jgi:hypothetical protein